MRAGHKWLFAFVDLLLAMNFVLMAVLAFLLPNINPPAKKDSDAIHKPGIISVLACWPEGPNDVDTWALAPGQDIATGYSTKSGEVWSLLRDDLGSSGDTDPVNCENLFARVTPAGEYIVNLHGYSLPYGPVLVHFEMAINATLILKEEIEIRPKQERTVARFRLDDKGNVVPGSMSKVFKPLRSEKK